jgi:hypothetical protein
MRTRVAVVVMGGGGKEAIVATAINCRHRQHTAIGAVGSIPPTGIHPVWYRSDQKHCLLVQILRHRRFCIDSYI